MDYTSAYLAAIIHSSDDAIIGKDLNARITSWNPAAEKIFGYSAAEAIGQDIRLIIPHDRLSEEELIISKIKKGEKVDHFETIRRRKNGQLINISITVSPIFDDSGKIIGASKIARDITDRIKKDAAFESTSVRLEVALAAAEMGDWSWDAKTDLVILNPVAAKIFELYPRTKITWTELQRHIIPEDAERAVKEVERAIAEHSHYSIQYRANIKNGIRWIAAKGLAQYDETGAAKGMVGVVQDVTAKKEQEITLEALNKLAPKISSTLDLQTLLQLATDEATRLTGAEFGAFFYNAINEEGKAYLLYILSGAPREAFSNLGMPRATAIFGPTFRGESTILLEDVLKDPRYGQSSPHYGMPKGHLPVRSYLAVPVISRGGEVIGGLFFGHPEPGKFSETDARLAEGIAAQAAIGIDNARLYEEVKKGKEVAEAASKAKTEFLATMSHEIRTPMNAVIGLSSILGMSEPLTAKQREYIKILQTSADSLLSLINDLLDISKIEARTVELEEIPFSISKIIQEIISMMNVRVQEKGLRLIASIETSSLQKKTFLGDPTRLKQIITNLCSNAVKFTEAGSITINVECKPTDDPIVEKLEISVKDTGIGIPADKIGTIFDKFIQADSSINRKYGGTGLGLAISKTLVEAMGGHISVTSEAEVGSVFTVEIPMKVPLVSASQGFGNDADLDIGLLSGIENASSKILLVEDHEPNILVAGTFLESLGFSYDVARNGAQAVELGKDSIYSLILMDIQMHGMNGWEATRLIRAYERKYEKARVPIIGLTAHAMAGDRERCIGVGMDDYLSKPFNEAELRDKIVKFLKVDSTGEELKRKSD